MAVNTQSPTRLHISREKKGNSTVTYTLTNDAETSCLYTIHTSKDSKPHMTVLRHYSSQTYHHGPPPPPPPPPPTHHHPAHNNPFSYFSSPPSYNDTIYHHQPNNPPPTYVVGTVNFHSLSSKIDVTMGPNKNNGNKTFTMKRPDPLASGHKFPSDTPLGTLEWKDENLIGSSKQKLLMDAQKRVIARYEKCGGSRLFLQRRRRREKDRIVVMMLPGAAAAEEYLDLIVLTGMASVEYARRSDEETMDWLGEAAENMFG
ncbi:hypothetical protein AJ80_01486 [Polytolypa hystricis UAMH7299]|uniref:Uncharacterized protein n=1 Tax=Polytolypa hystricis (strain UAMH7299) TaxID=1447883 RepID=A0A2B7Z101_POLH7|nr:hypothetical protein AJ80_01486 [Polytolypa hystricis UAMH7299]